MLLVHLMDVMEEQHKAEIRLLQQKHLTAMQEKQAEPETVNIPDPTEKKTCCEIAGMGVACGYRVDSVYRACEREIINNSEYDNETEQQKLQECRQSYESYRPKIYTEAECDIIRERVYN